MNTLSDIIALGNAAADAGEPLVDNWLQMRGALLMFGYAADGLDQVTASSFPCRFPADFDALPAAAQERIPNPQTYSVARTRVARLLAVLGEIDDPWEELRMLIRRAGHDDIERCLPGLATPAKAAGLVPAQITTDWVWSLDAERGVLSEEQLQRRSERERRHGQAPKAKLAYSVRQRLRQGVAVFNRLFDIPEIVASGLLPDDPIGPPPVYDRQGRRMHQLPPTLASYDGAGVLPQVWQAICNSEIFYLPVDPSADDLLASKTWEMIAQLPQHATGVAETTWHQYMLRARQALLPQVTLPVPERLPERFEAMITEGRDRWPLQALWRLMCERDMFDATPDDLLHLTTWRELWREVPSGTKPRTWAMYQGRARMMLLRHSTHQTDPYRVVTRAWADLPKHTKGVLAPIRKTAERALLRPLDLTPEWVSGQRLKSEQEAQVNDTLREVFFDAVMVRRHAPLPDPVEVAWEALRNAIRDQGISTVGLAKVSTPAIDDGMAPSDLTLDWAAATATKMDQRQRARFSMQLRNLNGLLSIPDLNPLLYAEPIGPLPDLRKHGKIEPPADIIAAVDAITATHRRAPSTRAEARATVRKIWTAAAKDLEDVKISTLDELLASADKLHLDKRTYSKAALLLRDLHSMREAA